MTDKPKTDDEIADVLSDDFDYSGSNLMADSESETEVPGQSGKSLTDRLLNAEPNPPLASVESPWNPEEGGVVRVMRGIQKLGDITGLPAIADIVIGVVEEMSKHDLDDSDSESEEWVMPDE